MSRQQSATPTYLRIERRCHPHGDDDAYKLLWHRRGPQRRRQERRRRQHVRDGGGAAAGGNKAAAGPSVGVVLNAIDAKADAYSDVEAEVLHGPTDCVGGKVRE